MRILSFLVIIALLFVPVVSAGGVGTTGAQFLKIDTSARPMGLGGAYSSVAADSNSIFYNPARLAGLDSREISGTYLNYFQAVDYGSMATAIPGSGNGVLGIGVNYLGVTDIQKRGVSDVDDLDGTSHPDTFGAMDTAISVGYGMKNPVPSVLESLDLGAVLRMTYQTIDDESAFSVMADLGGYYPVNDKLSLAAVIQNMGTGVKFKEETDPLPLNFKAGAAYKPVKNLQVACDINEYIIDQVFYASLGAEYWIKDIVALRAGYKYGYDTDSLGDSVGLAGGVGFRYSGLGLDYAFAPFGELGDTHRVTFVIGF